MPQSDEVGGVLIAREACRDSCAEPGHCSHRDTDEVKVWRSPTKAWCLRPLAVDAGSALPLPLTSDDPVIDRYEPTTSARERAPHVWFTDAAARGSHLFGPSSAALGSRD